jgi:hypothetical protein
MTLVRPTINLYYDKIVNENPVPNGASKYKINQQYFEMPVVSSQATETQVLRTTYFYNVMKACNVKVNLFTKGNLTSNLFYPLELSNRSNDDLITNIIPYKTLNRIKKKKMKLLILFQQLIGDYKLMRKLKDRIDYVIRWGIPAEQIYLVTGDINCAYQEMFGNVRVFGIDWWQIAYQLTCKTRYKEDDYHWVSFTIDDTKISETKIKKELINIDNWNDPKYLFTALAEEMSVQSLAIISELSVRGLISQGLCNFNTKEGRNVNIDSKIIIDKNMSAEYKELKKAEISRLANTTLTIEDLKSSTENSFFTIITEPFVPKLDKNYLSEINAMWVSARVWKCIAQGHPFIVIGSLSTMKYLNNEGYFSYVDIFNEAYDSVTDLAIKVNLIADEIERLSKLSKEEIQHKIKLTKPFILANKKRFYEKQHTWKFYDLFKEMEYERT